MLRFLDVVMIMTLSRTQMMIGDGPLAKAYPSHDSNPNVGHGDNHSADRFFHFHLFFSSNTATELCALRKQLHSFELNIYIGHSSWWGDGERLNVIDSTMTTSAVVVTTVSTSSTTATSTVGKCFRHWYHIDGQRNRNLEKEVEIYNEKALNWTDLKSITIRQLWQERVSSHSVLTAT